MRRIRRMKLPKEEKIQPQRRLPPNGKRLPIAVIPKLEMGA